MRNVGFCFLEFESCVLVNVTFGKKLTTIILVWLLFIQSGGILLSKVLAATGALDEQGGSLIIYSSQRCQAYTLTHEEISLGQPRL